MSPCIVDPPMRERAASAASPMAPILKAVANRKRWAEKPAAEQEQS
jgi:hypothetical protein